MSTPRCSRCFKDATRVAFGKWLNGRAVDEPVCDEHAPLAADVGTIRLYDTWQHTRHPAREYRVAGSRPFEGGSA